MAAGLPLEEGKYSSEIMRNYSFAAVLEERLLLERVRRFGFAGKPYIHQLITEVDAFIWAENAE